MEEKETGYFDLKGILTKTLNIKVWVLLLIIIASMYLGQKWF